MYYLIQTPSTRQMELDLYDMVLAGPFDANIHFGQSNITLERILACQGWCVGYIRYALQEEFHY
jgi:hypothetical protein